jgi:glucosamine--fructose-6-phosphate aminotransferase (isomerizing)
LHTTRTSQAPIAPLIFRSKFRQVSYLHAEAYLAAELKHGPLALISPGTPTVAVILRDDLYGKNISTIEEIRARRGPVFALTHPGELPAAIEVPASEPELDPILLNIPLQLLAYHVGLKRACDIDKPRNLAKSVTVE